MHSEKWAKYLIRCVGGCWLIQDLTMTRGFHPPNENENVWCCCDTIMHKTINGVNVSKGF